jgi:methyl-accepting chemotaxis protein
MLRKTLFISQSAALLLILVAMGMAIHYLTVQNREVVQSWKYLGGQVESLYEIRQLIARSEGALSVAEQGQPQMAVDTVMACQSRLEDILNSGSLAFLKETDLAVEIKYVFASYTKDVLSLINQSRQGYDVSDASMNAIPAYQMEIGELVSKAVEKQHQVAENADTYWAQQLVSLKQEVYMLMGFAVMIWVGISIGTYRLVLAPIQEMAEAADAMAAGRYTVQIPRTPMHSEALGKMRHALKRLAAKSRHYHAHSHAHHAYHR